MPESYFVNGFVESSERLVSTVFQWSASAGPGFFAVITGQLVARDAFSFRYSDHFAGRSSWLKIASVR